MQEKAPTNPAAGEPSIVPVDSDTSSRGETVRTNAGPAGSEDPEDAFAEDEDADDADADNTSGGDDESVYSNEDYDNDDDDDDDEDDSTEQPLGPIGTIFAQRRDRLHETYLGMKSSGQSQAETPETAQTAESAEIAGARVSWTEWAQHTEFLQLVEQSMWSDRYKPLSEEHERLRSIQAYLNSAEFQTAWDASEESKDPGRDIGQFRKKLDQWITNRRLSRLLTRRLSGSDLHQSSSVSKRSSSDRVASGRPGQATLPTGKSNKRHRGGNPSKLRKMTHVDAQSPT